MKKRIIIAEDSSIIRNLTQKILSHFNYEIKCVKNGQQVLTLLMQQKFDVVLLDILMPVMNGMECAKKIRNLPAMNKNIPIVAITGNIKNYTMKDFQKVGINDFIPKPLNYDAVVEVVKKYTDDN